jgi:membrane protein implicated in regulation of membrane protease activity
MSPANQEVFTRSLTKIVLSLASIWVVWRWQKRKSQREKAERQGRLEKLGKKQP